jgi:hypothetical protein
MRPQTLTKRRRRRRMTTMKRKRKKRKKRKKEMDICLGAEQDSTAKPRPAHCCGDHREHIGVVLGGRERRDS